MGEGGFKNGQKNSYVFYGRPLGGRAEAYVHNGLKSFLKSHPYSYSYFFIYEPESTIVKKTDTQYKK